MDNHRVHYLLKAFVADLITRSEINELFEWIKQYEEESLLLLDVEDWSKSVPINKDRDWSNMEGICHQIGGRIEN